MNAHSKFRKRDYYKPKKAPELDWSAIIPVAKEASVTITAPAPKYSIGDTVTVKRKGVSGSSGVIINWELRKRADWEYGSYSYQVSGDFKLNGKPQSSVWCYEKELEKM